MRSLLTLALAALAATLSQPQDRTVVWVLDRLDRIGGHATTVTGAPRIVATDLGPAMEFDGVDDGVFLDVNPLAGLARFTVEVQFQPAADGPGEQRFLHFQERDTEDRALVELRLESGTWALDTYLRDGEAQLVLLDQDKRHPAGRWHVAALVYDGATMSSFVDGVAELSGTVTFAPLATGRTSIGVRQNKVWWFKGRIRQVRITPRALAPAELHRSQRGPQAAPSQAPPITWARGIEGQRKADLGDGTFLNPIMAGDHPDPSILKDGADYYMTFSSFDAYPGLALWHSRDLVNWQPIAATLRRNVGSVWAPDLVKHGGRYFIYFPARTATYRSNYVIWADNIRGPWSDPIDLKIGNIDPGHAVETDGRRYLFLSAGMWVPLSADGLSVTGPMTKVYDGWKYPADWIVESYSQEGPKILRRGEYFYQVLAEGGTAGPPTGHMIVAARARRLEGPWENSPYNPILRTASGSERWWSKGHGTLVEGPGGQWYVVYHAYENGFYTLGRQTLLEPIEWTSDGWFRAAGVDVARPIPKPRGEAVPHGAALSDDFSTNKMGTQWSFYNGSEADQQRVRYDRGALVLSAKGTNPVDSAPLWFVAGDHAYEIEVDAEISPGATCGILLFYSRRLYAGLGVSDKNFILHRYGTERPMAKPENVGRSFRLRLRNDRHIVTIDYSVDRKTWERFGTGMEVSGYHHNVAGDFLSLRPALYAAGAGEVRFRDFRYRALP